MGDGILDWLRRALGGGASAGPDNAPEPEPARGQTRRFRLGLDWGTSATKLVLRDYGAPGDLGSASLLTPQGRGLRYPSTVTMEGGRLWFGWEAEERRPRGTVWRSLKAEAGVGSRWGQEAGADGLVLRDLVHLSLAHHMAVGFAAARAQAADKGATPSLEVTVGVPVLDSAVGGPEYHKAAAVAYELAVRRRLDVQGMALPEAVDALRGDREKVMPGLANDPLKAEAWLRPEVVASMAWPLKSPRIGEGPFTCIDIGAATTHASFFRILPGEGEPRRPKGRLLVYGAATGRQAMDAMCRALAGFDGSREWWEWRGREHEVPARSRGGSKVTEVIDGIGKTWAKARQDAAYHGEGWSMTSWEGLRLLWVGGGSRVLWIRERFARPPGAARNVRGFHVVADLGRPDDLWLADAAGLRTGKRPPPVDSAFASVAYGLSFRTGDLPEVTLPDGLPPRPAPPPRTSHRPDRDDIYPK